MDAFVSAEETFDLVREQVVCEVEHCPTNDMTITLMDLRKRLSHAVEQYMEAGMSLLKTELSWVSKRDDIRDRIRRLELELEDEQILNFNEGGVETILAEIEEEKEKLDLLETSKSVLDSDIRRLRNELPRTEDLQEKISHAKKQISETKIQLQQFKDESVLLTKQVAHQVEQKKEFDTLTAKIRMIGVETQKLADQIYLKGKGHETDELKELQHRLQAELDELDEFQPDSDTVTMSKIALN